MGFIVFIHMAACIFLVITILMQAGKGGGLAESFSSAESMFGTQTNRFMVRTSSVLATIFLTTSLVLAVFGSKSQTSLMSNKAMIPQTSAKPATPAEPEVSVKVSTPQPMETPAESPAAPVVNAAQ